MTKKTQYIVFGGIVVLAFLWLTRLSGVLLLGIVCLAGVYAQKRFGVQSIDDFEARVAAMPRLARVAIAVVFGAYIGHFIGRMFLIHTSLLVMITAAGFGYAIWHISAARKPPAG